MYVINVHYKVDIKIVDLYLVVHREYLDSYYQKGLLLCSGPREPRDGGIIIALMSNTNDINNFIQNDPFYKNGVADYTLVKFHPVKFHELINKLLPSAK